MPPKPKSATSRIEEKLDDLIERMTRQEEHTNTWIGNQKPGYIPVKLDKMDKMVDSHEAFINGYNGAKEERDKHDRRISRQSWIAIVVAVITCLGALGVELVK